MDYSLLKPILFRIPPEQSHYLALNFLRLLHTLGLSRHFSKPQASPRVLMGLTFPNAVGLAAGFDKNGDYIDALAALGFGFIEVGTVTPQPQVGNSLPRLFRLPQQLAIINRMGFNNKGVDYLVSRLRKMDYKGILGVNIGKGRETPIEQATEDYLYCFRRVAPYASYVTVNISSPNTEGLRDLQQAQLLRSLLGALKAEQALYCKTQAKYVPLLVKIAPDLSDVQVCELAEILRSEKIDGVIATNTTLSREGLEGSPYLQEAGGLSGKPLSLRSTEVIQQLSMILGDVIPIIASGGVMSVQDAAAKLAAGASLLQVYSGLVYQGPGFVGELCAGI